MKRLTYRVNIGVPEDVILVDHKSVEECQEWKNVLERLAYYEDLEEQGLLLKLPCGVDSEVWYIDEYGDLYTRIVRGVVDGYLWFRTCGFALDVVWDKPVMGYIGCRRKEVPFSKIGKTVFLTQAEAEEALKGMEGVNEQ